jgi:hypothetical protein
LRTCLRNHRPPPGGLAARILAWLTEKFTRNFSGGKDLQQLLKISSAGRIFGHLADRDADFLADPLAVAETGDGQMHPVFCRIDGSSTYAVKRPAIGGFL